MKVSLPVFLSVILLVAGNSMGAVKQGDTEINAMGGWADLSDKDGTSFNYEILLAAGAVNYFVTDNVQVGAGLMGIWIDYSDNDKANIYGLGTTAKYHFMTNQTYCPYVGAQFYFAKFDSDNSADDMDGIAWGPVAGVRFELNEKNDFYVEYDHVMFNGDLGDELDDAGLLIMGIVHQFK